jgi:hypothetical protein
MEFGFIYRAYCDKTNKSYIGQAKEFKTKNGKKYKYGITGRWSDHVSSSKNHSTPLAEAIKTYGEESFELFEIVRAPLSDLDTLEAEWIQTKNTIVPNGYNVVSRSRNKHNKDVSSFHKLFEKKVQFAEIHPIKCNDINKIVYVYLTLNNNERKRVTFGQDQNINYEEALKDAYEFVEKLECAYIDFTKDTFAQQKYLVSQLTGNIEDITITTASQLIAVYIMTNNMEKRDERLRICFGGKTISKENAYTTAMEFVKELNLDKSVKIIDKIATQSRQQAAASTDGVSP